MNVVSKKIRNYASLAALVALSMTGCAPGLKVKPELVEVPSPSSGFVMKSFHQSMKGEMRRSYDRADEIVIGVFTGIHKDKKNGIIYYFSDFSMFDKKTLSWDSPQNVIVQVRQDELKPEIIQRNEFKRLVDLDKSGICWDYYEGSRSVFLVEGKMNLIFLEMGFDETSSTSYWRLLDAYPVTDECRARDVFDLMIQDLILFIPE
jgi:hypothetical protein